MRLEFSVYIPTWYMAHLLMSHCIFYQLLVLLAISHLLAGVSGVSSSAVQVIRIETLVEVRQVHDDTPSPAPPQHQSSSLPLALVTSDSKAPFRYESRTQTLLNPPSPTPCAPEQNTLRQLAKDCGLKYWTVCAADILTESAITKVATMTGVGQAYKCWENDNKRRNSLCYGPPSICVPLGALGQCEVGYRLAASAKQTACSVGGSDDIQIPLITFQKMDRPSSLPGTSTSWTTCVGDTCLPCRDIPCKEVDRETYQCSGPRCLHCEEIKTCDPSKQTCPQFYCQGPTAGPPEYETRTGVCGLHECTAPVLGSWFPTTIRDPDLPQNCSSTTSCETFFRPRTKSISCSYMPLMETQHHYGKNGVGGVQSADEHTLDRPLDLPRSTTSWGTCLDLVSSQRPVTCSDWQVCDARAISGACVHRMGCIGLMTGRCNPASSPHWTSLPKTIYKLGRERPSEFPEVTTEWNTCHQSTLPLSCHDECCAARGQPPGRTCQPAASAAPAVYFSGKSYTTISHFARSEYCLSTTRVHCDSASCTRDWDSKICENRCCLDRGYQSSWAAHRWRCAPDPLWDDRDWSSCEPTPMPSVWDNAVMYTVGPM
jgi:hypothetical protein